MSSTKSNPNAARRVHHLARQFTRAVTGGSAAVPGAPVDEDALFSQTVADVEALFRRPRYKFTKRPYTAEAVARLRGSASLVQGGQAPLSSACADKLYSMLRGYMNNGRPTGEFSHTFGCLDPVQLVQMGECVGRFVWVFGASVSSALEATAISHPNSLTLHI